MPHKRKTPLPFPRSGECIRYYRELRGLTQEELADKINISSSYMGYIERGRQMASIGNLYKISRVLAVPIEELLDPSFRTKETGSLHSVLTAQIQNLDEEECRIAYELISRIVPMIRQESLRKK